MRRPKLKSGERIFLLNDFCGHGNDLFLYEGYEEKYHTFGYFLECGLKNNEFCGYVYPRDSEKINFEHCLPLAEQVRYFPIADEKIKTVRAEHIEQVRDKIKELYCAVKPEHNAFRLQIDFGNTLNEDNFNAIVELEEEMHNGNVIPASTLSAFNVKMLDQEIAKELIKLHERVIISTKNETSISFSRDKIDSIPSIDMVSSESMEQCVKNSLEAIILSLLNQRPMCGFDVIKTIVQNFKVLLSQGTVYPILYSLKEQGYVESQMRPDNKTRVYMPTEAGRRYIEEQIREYLIAQENVIGLVARGV